MLEEWTHLPRWFKLSTALAVLGFSAYWAAHGVLWPWGFGIGLLLFVMSFMKPLGPPRKKSRPPVEPATNGKHENPYRSTPSFSSTLDGAEDTAKADAMRSAESRRRVRRPRPSPGMTLVLGAAIAVFAILALTRFWR